MDSLLDGFARSATDFPHHNALELQGRRWTYQALAAQAGRLCAALDQAPRSRGPLVGVLAAHSATAYQAVLAILANRRGIVPLDPHHPPAWLIQRLDHAGLDTLVVGPEGLDRLATILAELRRPLTIIAPEVRRLQGLAARHRRHRFLAAPQVDHHRQPLPIPPLEAHRPASLLYTSGTTGPPRAVLLGQGHLAAYLGNAAQRFEVHRDDRCSHTFPLTFDLSLHDLLTTWSSGATLVPWPTHRRADPARFITDQRLTRWFSVPSVAMTMARLGELRPGRFPCLRHSLFGGEALPTSVARAWQQAAPNSRVFNLYGPTEATIAIAAYPVDQAPSLAWGDRPIVPLGRPFDDQHFLVLDRQGRQVHEAGQGELWLSGPQVIAGYHTPKGTPPACPTPFVERQGRTWFRTGDQVALDPFGCLHFLGRLDERIKLRGHHLHLPQIDQTLRRACGHSLACAVPHRAAPAAVAGLVAMIESDQPLDAAPILATCRRHLPPPWVPDRLVVVPHLPRNDRGKLDRRAMQQLLHSQED